MGGAGAGRGARSWSEAWPPASSLVLCARPGAGCGRPRNTTLGGSWGTPAPVKSGYPTRVGPRSGAGEIQNSVCLSPERPYFSLPCGPRLDKAGLSKASFQKLQKCPGFLEYFRKAECLIPQTLLNGRQHLMGVENGVQSLWGGAHGDYGLE